MIVLKQSDNKQRLRSRKSPKLPCGTDEFKKQLGLIATKHFLIKRRIPAQLFFVFGLFS